MRLTPELRIERGGYGMVVRDYVRLNMPDMAGMMGKCAAISFRLAVRRAVDQVHANLVPSEFFGKLTPEMERATAITIVAQDLGYTYNEVHEMALSDTRRIELGLVPSFLR